MQHRSFNNPYYRSQLFKSNWTKFEQTSYVNSIVLGAVHIATLPTADAILIKLVNLLNTALYSIDPVLQIERNGYRKKLYSLTFLLAIQLFTPIAINSSANFFFRRSGNFSQCTVGWNFDYFIAIFLVYTANVYRQTTDKLMFKSVISTVRWIRK